MIVKRDSTIKMHLDRSGNSRRHADFWDGRRGSLLPIGGLIGTNHQRGWIAQGTIEGRLMT